MAPRITPPFRADHVGSLLRPPELHQARADHADGRIDADQLRAVEDEAVRSAVRLQADAGLRSATDGEFRRGSWHMDFIYALGGVEKVMDSTLKVEFRNADGTMEFTPPSMRIASRVRLDHTIFADAFGFLTEQVGCGHHAQAHDPLAEHGALPRRAGRRSTQAVYPDIEEFWADLTAAYAEQVRRLGEVGCRYLQLDDTSLAYLNDPRQREHAAAIGGDPEHQHEAYIRHINEALAGRPEGMAVTTHMCRGNFRSAWAAEGELRVRRRGALHATRRRRLLPRVRRRALRRLRAAAVRARRGRWSCSASSRPSAASSSARTT